MLNGGLIGILKKLVLIRILNIHPKARVDEKISHHYLNLTQASEISEADYVWSPTLWQKQQFPKSIQQRIQVIHEGIDTNMFIPFKIIYKLNRQ